MYSFLYLKLLRGTQVFVIIRLHFVLSIFLYLSILSIFVCTIFHNV